MAHDFHHHHDLPDHDHGSDSMIFCFGCGDFVDANWFEVHDHVCCFCQGVVDPDDFGS